MNKHILEQAADWLDRIHELNNEEKQQLSLWLQSPENRIAFDKMAKIFLDPDIKAALYLHTQQSAKADADRVVQLAQNKPKPAPSWQKLALVASFSAIVLSSYWLVTSTEQATQTITVAKKQYSQIQQTLHSKVGERLSKLLDDGSYIHLNANSELTAKLNNNIRQIEIKKGQVFLDIAKDKNRPFVITSGEISIKVLGTSFEVERIADTVSVTVYEGRVQVSASESFVLEPPQKIVLKNGHITLFDEVQLTQLPSWRTGWIEANGESLFSIIQQIQRYSPKPIKIDAMLSKKLVNGRFKLEDPYASLQLIAATYNWQLTEKDDNLYLKPL